MTTELSRELLRRISLVKQSLDDIKKMPFSHMMKKAAKVEMVVQDAVFIIEEMANEQARMQVVIEELKSGAVNG